jgi:hypothetical protein
MFDSGQVKQDCPGPDSDRIIVAELTGAAQRHARWRPLAGSETADAVAELQEIAGDRADLLSEVAGILLGACEGALDEPRAKSAAQVCRRVGAGETLIPRWMEEGSAVLDRPRDAVLRRPARIGSCYRPGNAEEDQMTGRIVSV